MLGSSRNCISIFSLVLIVALGSAEPKTGDRGIVFPDTTVTIGNVTVMSLTHPRLTIVGVPDTLVFLYLPRNNVSLDSAARRENLRCLINGSFFDGVRGTATHAGWLSLYGNRVTPMMDDRQLTHVVRINGSTKSIEFIPVRSFNPSSDPREVEFQTGPLVIDSGTVREDLIRSSINGPTRHLRTLLATIDRRKCFLITVTESVTLSDLADALKRLPVFQHGRLDVINLDGGSSVALYLRDTRGFDFNAGDRLPILIGFH